MKKLLSCLILLTFAFLFTATSAEAATVVIDTPTKNIDSLSNEFGRPHWANFFVNDEKIDCFPNTFANSTTGEKADVPIRANPLTRKITLADQEIPNLTLKNCDGSELSNGDKVTMVIYRQDADGSIYQVSESTQGLIYNGSVLKFGENDIKRVTDSNASPEHTEARDAELALLTAYDNNPCNITSGVDPNCNKPELNEALNRNKAAQDALSRKENPPTNGDAPTVLNLPLVLAYNSDDMYCEGGRAESRALQLAIAERDNLAIKDKTTIGATDPKVKAAEEKVAAAQAASNAKPLEIATAIGCISATPLGLVAAVLNIALGVAGGLAFMLMVFGAFIMITSGGSPDSLQRGRTILTSAIAGLLVIILSVFILRFFGVQVLKLPALSQQSATKAAP